MIALLLMFAGLAYGVYMFLAFVLCVLAPDEADEAVRKWLDSLPPKKRKAYLHHKKRQREYARLVKRRRKACYAIAQRMYDKGADNPHPLDVWYDAGEQVGREEGWRPGIDLFNSYKDVWDDPDWVSTEGGVEPMYKRMGANEDVFMDLDRWRDKPKKPSWA